MATELKLTGCFVCLSQKQVVLFAFQSRTSGICSQHASVMKCPSLGRLLSFVIVCNWYTLNTHNLALSSYNSVACKGPLWFVIGLTEPVMLSPKDWLRLWKAMAISWACPHLKLICSISFVFTFLKSLCLKTTEFMLCFFLVIFLSLQLFFFVKS